MWPLLQKPGDIFLVTVLAMQQVGATELPLQSVTHPKKTWGLIAP